MKCKSSTDNLLLREFTASKQTKLFQSLQRSRVSGCLTLTNPLHGEEWRFYLDGGQIVYATGGVHCLRRWQRNLMLNLPQIDARPSQLSYHLRHREAENTSQSCWEYHQLSSWVKQGKISREQGNRAVEFSIEEILFDIVRGIQVICNLDQEDFLFPQLSLVAPESTIIEVDYQWQEWQKARIADRSPNLAPVIKQPQQLKQQVDFSVYQQMCKWLDGNRTIRDLAVYLQRTPLQVTRSFQPYIQSGILDLVEVDDLSLAANLGQNKDSSASVELDRPLVACVDDSPMVCQMLEQILTLAGYRYAGINDPEAVIPFVLENKPSLILLDIVMPDISGYDLCAKLSQYPEIQDTPIIFLTSSDSLIDRLRAKMVGAADFVKKTVDADRLLSKISEYIY
jgi:chemotaxis family two-component system response regulator PixG